MSNRIFCGSCRICKRITFMVQATKKKPLCSRCSPIRAKFSSRLSKKIDSEELTIPEGMTRNQFLLVESERLTAIHNSIKKEAQEI